MYFFFFIYFFTLRKIVQFLGGNYVDSLSSYSLLLNIFSPCDNFLDIVFITLAGISSIHHSIRLQYQTPLHRFIHACDSSLITCIMSYLIFHKLAFYPICMSLLSSFVVLYVEYFYKFRILKKIACFISGLISLQSNIYHIVPMTIALSFFIASPYWDRHNFYRFGWHVSSTVYILTYLITTFNT